MYPSSIVRRLSCVGGVRSAWPSAGRPGATRFLHAAAARSSSPEEPTHGPAKAPTSGSTARVLPCAARTGLLFPGQGAQRVGACVRQLEAEWPAIVRPVWQEMDEAIQTNLSRIMKDGLMSELSQTEHAQPAILAHSYALWRVLSHTLGLTSASSIARLALGHSLGEYTALTVAGAIPFAQATQLVHQRGLAMKYANPPGSGGMVAILSGQSDPPLDVDQLKELLRECEDQARSDSRDTACVLDLANLNTPQQIVVAGSTKALDVLKDRIRTGTQTKADPLTRGILRAIPLDVSGAFHSRLMMPARPALAAQLSRVDWQAPSVKVVFNVHAHASQRTDRFTEYLTQQLTSPVRWHESIAHCLQHHGVTNFIELGPSTPLSGMLRAYAKRAATPTASLQLEEDEHEAALAASIEQAAWAQVKAWPVHDRTGVDDIGRMVAQQQQQEQPR